MGLTRKPSQATFLYFDSIWPWRGRSSFGSASFRNGYAGVQIPSAPPRPPRSTFFGSTTPKRSSKIFVFGARSRREPRHAMTMTDGVPESLLRHRPFVP